MNFIKLTFPVMIALAYAPAHAVSAGASGVDQTRNLGASVVSGLGYTTVFSYTASTMGASSTVYGGYFSGGVITTAASGTVTGNFTSVGATNVGASATVNGSLLSGGVMTIGDTGSVIGNVTSSGAGTLGANGYIGGFMRSGGVVTVGATATVKGAVTGPAEPVISASATAPIARVAVGSDVVPASLTGDLTAKTGAGGQRISSAQNALSALTTTTTLAATQITDRTFTAGVYQAASWTTTAGITLTLDAQKQDNAAFIFNFADIFSTGASTKIYLINAGQNNSVIWNAYAGYAQLGASTDLIGTVLANTYIEVGASSHLTGTHGACGGAYSATSYVHGGASAVFGGIGCAASGDVSAYATPSKLAVVELPDEEAMPVAAVPEPQTYALLLAGLASMAFAARRRNSAV